MTSTINLLGYSARSKLLLIHADDLGLCHSVNLATLNALAERAIGSASLMVPASGFDEAVRYAHQHPDLDLGVHWTLTSEWPHCKWGPSLRNLCPTLVDEFGCFPRLFTLTRLNAPEVEAEISEQWRQVMSAGMDPTHVDTHMLALLQCPESIAIYTRLARHCGVPFFMPAQCASFASHLIHRNDILVDRIFSARPTLPDHRWMDYYLAVLRSIQPGLSQLTVHLGYDDHDLRSITRDQRSWGSAWRQRDYEAVMSSEFKAALRASNIQVVTWRELTARKRACSLQAESERDCCTAGSLNGL